MVRFNDIKVLERFFYEDCMGFSHWLKISDKMAKNMGGNNGKFELNQEKPFDFNPIVKRYQHE